VALSALLREIAAWQRDHGRVHQADAALSAADALSCMPSGQGTPAIDGLAIPAPATTTHRDTSRPQRRQDRRTLTQGSGNTAAVGYA